ncbi:MAG: GNAT family N-acetyltransferase [Legionellales bacterium]|jgi:hypothetical protein
MKNEYLLSGHIINNMTSMLRQATALNNKNLTELIIDENFCSYYSGSALPLFNGVFCERPADEAAYYDYLSKIMPLFQRDKVGLTLWWLQQTQPPASILEILNKYGFQHEEEYTGIAANIMSYETLKINLDKDFFIKTVTNDGEYNDFIDTFTSVFGLSGEVKKDCFNMLKWGDGGIFKHYLCFLNQRPIATLSSYTHSNVIGLYNGATLPEFRNNGICTALIQRACVEGRGDGIKIAVGQLTSANMAKNLCENLGFQKECSLKAFYNLP